MVGSVSSNSVAMMQQTTQNSSTSTLTDAQLETISSTLEQYDSTNLSSEDAASIVAAFQSAGIEESEELENAMEEAGFNAKEVGEAAGIGGPQGGGGMPPPPPSEEEVSEVTDLLDTLLSTDEDDDETSSIDEIMEYTNRILNLNEDSKTEVMDILEKYSANEEGYTETEISNIVSNSLSSILSDSSNYTKISLYA